MNQPTRLYNQTNEMRNTINYGEYSYECVGIKGAIVEYFVVAATTGAFIGVGIGMIAGIAVAVVVPVLAVSATVDLVKLWATN